jgi:hypothetical protein
MHCPAIPSNLDRAKQGSIDSMDLRFDGLQHLRICDGHIDPLTDHAVK